MVEVAYSNGFKKRCRKVRHTSLKLNLKNLIDKIKLSPTVGKPMGGNRKNTREVYMDSFRISYSYSKDENIIKFLSIYHKDDQ